MKKYKLLIAALALLAALALAGCAPANDAQFELVFGQSSSSLIPTVGNSAYRDRALFEEEKTEAGAEDGVEDAGGSAEAEDTYIDPTEGLDCSED